MLEKLFFSFLFFFFAINDWNWICEIVSAIIVAACSSSPSLEPEGQWIDRWVVDVSNLRLRKPSRWIANRTICQGCMS